ncbi:MAG: ATP-dependent DNA helicase RecG [Clostridiales bacterium]
MKNIFTEILKEIEKESRLGYGDYSVFGGFYEFAKAKFTEIKNQTATSDNADTLNNADTLDSPVAEILALLENYNKTPLSQRPMIMKNVEAKIQKMAADQPCEKEEDVAERNAMPKEPPPLQYIKSVGPKRVNLLKKLGINNVDELIEYYPKRHEDRRKITAISQIIPGENAVICGFIKKVESYRLKKNLQITKAFIADDTGSVVAIWFNQTWLKDQLKTGEEIMIYGRADFRYGKRQFSVSEFAPAHEKVGFGILPVYSLTEGINQKLLRNIINNALALKKGEIAEYLPFDVREKYHLVGREWAINHYHFPDELIELQDARRRIVFDEFLLMRLSMGVIRDSVINGGISQNRGKKEKFRSFLPYELTTAQNRVIDEISADMAANTQMMRLLEGDVGSGKTAVAAWAIYQSWKSGHQSALMAPTEILATQHYHSMQKLFGNTRLEIALLTGSTSMAKKKEIYENLQNGKIDLLIGTHALVEEKTVFHDLSLAVVDEQHRFGVKQRELLVAKGSNPDCLVLTATPIPRTLAMTVFADLSLSVLDEMPPGREVVKTYVITSKEEMRALNFIKKYAQKGFQSYIVCPLVEESESLDLASATDLYDRLKSGFFNNISVGLIHGKMKTKEKEEVMQKFRKNEISVLVSTTVIEVGVDVPNAVIMLIRDAHRFGLAQLHQIRGRIGRGTEQSFCILEYGGGGDIAKKRMDIMVKYHDGFKIAEEDLKLRGPGDFFGIRQHGLADLQIADLYLDCDILAEASTFATELLKENPTLKGDKWQIMRYWLKQKKRLF